ncbi:MAG: YezD family protein [Candidatus Omnitrophica bacterium]|nr:YezD family protein [Candidatus Omnitrophota bacterium]MBU4473225.1 YezD family protein [Candidatus Omnitrophota bacterium]MCG2706588.1 YezD family protein [Candidatus Omnitrophota bacterium]
MRNNKNILNDAIIQDIATKINDLKYGSIVIKVHDSKIVQIEVSQKSRFDDIWLVEKGGGI